MVDISIIILTFNEELHLLRAINSVKLFAKEIYVIDSFSTDNTLKVAAESGVKVMQHEFINYSKQMQWAIENLPLNTAWVMRLDADEIVDDILCREIQNKLPLLDVGVTGVILKCKQIFMNRWIKYGGVYPLWLLRIWRNGCAQIEDRWMDEHMLLKKGRAIKFKGCFSNHDLHDITYFINKHNYYATREAVEIICQRLGLGISDGKSSFNIANSSIQAYIKRLIKIHIYNKLPYWFGPLIYFYYRLFFRGGIFDGREGLIYHTLQGFWFRFLINVKVLELEAAIRGVTGDDAIFRILENKTKLILRRP